MKIVVSSFLLLIFFTVLAKDNKKDLGGFYSKIDSLAIVDITENANLQISTCRQQFKKKFSAEELQIFNQYISFHSFYNKQEFDSAHVALLNALQITEDYKLESESIIYILEQLATLNIQINNATVGKEYIEKIKSYIGTFDYAEESYINALYLYAFQKQDTLLLKQAYKQQIPYFSSIGDSISLWYAESNLFRLNNQYIEAINKLKRILEEDTIYNTIVLYELISSYETLDEKDSILKYTELYIPYLDNAPTTIKRDVLRLIIDYKISSGDTTNLKELQHNYIATKNPLADGFVISNIAKREIEQLKIKSQEKITLKTYFIIFFCSLLVILSVTYILNKKYKQKINSISQLKPSISTSKEEKIKDQIEMFIIKKGFLDPSISQTKIVEDFNIGNVKYLSQIIKKEYKKKFPIFIKDLRINYLKENYNQEFKGLKKNEIATKLGFGSYRTFKDYVEQSSGISLSEFLKRLQ